MGDDDDRAEALRFARLLEKAKGINMTVIADLLQQCDHDQSRVSDILEEMIEQPRNQPADANDNPTPPASPADEPAVEDVQPNSAHNAGSSNTETRPEYKSLFPSLADTLPSAHKATSHQAQAPALQGAWANQPMARTYQVDRLWQKYQWMQKKAINALLIKHNDNHDRVEQDILQMFPIDEPAGFNGGTGSSKPPNAPSSAQAKRPRPIQTQQERAIAESLRQQAAEQMQRDALRPAAISASSKEMVEMRTRLWETRKLRHKLQNVANATQNPSRITSAQQKDAELRQLSESFLAKLKMSTEYKDGYIDLHGLSKEEALTLIESKLQDGGRRKFRVITGKGLHSQNEQAVLKPALEKYLSTNRVSFSIIEDGVISVDPSSCTSPPSSSAR